METLLRSCAKVCELIELSFGMVSGVSTGIDVLDRGSMCKGKGSFTELFPIRFNGSLLSRNVLDACMKS